MLGENLMEGAWFWKAPIERTGREGVTVGELELVPVIVFPSTQI